MSLGPDRAARSWWFLITAAAGYTWFGFLGLIAGGALGIALATVLCGLLALLINIRDLLAESLTERGTDLENRERTLQSATARADAARQVVDTAWNAAAGGCALKETPVAARAAALSECGAGCSVMLTFNRCGAYAADQDAGSTAVGWAESYDSADGARQAAVAE